MTFFDEEDGDDGPDPYDREDPSEAAGSTAIDGLAPPRAMGFIEGHDAIETRLAAMATGKRIPHALIFTGPQGIGKATMAFRLARFLLSHPPEGDDAEAGLFGEALPAAPATSLHVSPESPVFRQVASGGHPDLLSIEPAEGKSGVLVDDARRIGPFMRMTSPSGGWRVAIIDAADTMNRSSQNAILKILEEPPPKVMLILITQGLGALLPTIRSRCQVVDFKPLTAESCAAVLSRAPAYSQLSPDEKDLVASVSENSPGRALRYVEAGLPSVLADAAGVIAHYPSVDWAKAHHLADFLAAPGNAVAYGALTEVFVFALQRSARIKARGGEGGGLFGTLATRCPLETLVEICENLERHFRQADVANLDKRQTILGAYSIMKADSTR